MWRWIRIPIDSLEIPLRLTEHDGLVCRAVPVCWFSVQAEGSLLSQAVEIGAFECSLSLALGILSVANTIRKPTAAPPPLIAPPLGTGG